MCTQKSEHEVVVCDVALPDVRRELADLPGVTLTHLPYEGTRVHSTGEVDTATFRATLSAAIAPHGGFLPA